MKPNDGPKRNQFQGQFQRQFKGQSEAEAGRGRPAPWRFPVLRDLSANLAFGRAYRQGLEELGLTYPQWIAIVALWEKDGQTVSALGDKMFLESNTLTPILKKLESMGYLRRRRDPADERQVRVSLTDEGRRLREKGMHMNLVKSTGMGKTSSRGCRKASSRSATI